MFQVLNKTYRKLGEVSGNGTDTTLRSNALDDNTAYYLVQCATQIDSSNSFQITVDLVDTSLILTTGNWIDYGMEAGVSLLMTRYNNDGTIAQQSTVLVNTIVGNIMYLNSIIAGLTQGMVFDGVNKLRLLDTNNADYLEINVNYVNNNSQGANQSSIDGEVTTFIASGINSLVGGGGITLSKVGNKSGNYDTNIFVTFSAIAGNFRRYLVGVSTKNPFPLIQNAYNGSDSPKLSLNFKTKRNANSIGYIDNVFDAPECNLGGFNEAYNIGNENSQLLSVTGGECYYNANTEFTFKINTVENVFYSGAVYVSTDEDYFQNKVFSQSELGMTSPTLNLASYSGYAINGVHVYSSKINPQGASYDLHTTTVSVISPTQTEFKIVIDPNSIFTNFMESRSIGDRRFIVWFKAGNVNHVIFDGQLTKKPTAIIRQDTEGFKLLRHDENFLVVPNNELIPMNSGNQNVITEDDLAYFVQVNLLKDIKYKQLNVIMSLASTLGESAELERFTFDLSNIPMINGMQNFNLSQPTINHLPTTSAKKNFTFKNDNSYPISTKRYGAELYFPFFARWQYWQNQILNNTFFGNFGKNWEAYLNGIPTNLLAFKIQLIDEDDKFYEVQNGFTIETYDNREAMLTKLELFRENGTPASSFVSGELMTIKGTCVLNEDYEPFDNYGVITIEQFEGDVSYILSTEVPFDYNANNPLQPITGIFATKTIISSNTIEISCNIDVNKLNLSTEYSIGVRIAMKEKRLVNKLLQSNGFELLQNSNNNIEIV